MKRHWPAACVKWHKSLTRKALWRNTGADLQPTRFSVVKRHSQLLSPLNLVEGRFFVDPRGPAVPPPILPYFGGARRTLAMFAPVASNGLIVSVQKDILNVQWLVRFLRPAPHRTPCRLGLSRVDRFRVESAGAFWHHGVLRDPIAKDGACTRLPNLHHLLLS